MLKTWRWGWVRVVASVTVFDRYVDTDSVFEWQFYQTPEGEIVALPL